MLEGLAVALANIDEVIELIKQAASRDEAKKGLMDRIWQSGAVEQMLEPLKKRIDDVDHYNEAP